MADEPPKTPASDKSPSTPASEKSPTTSASDKPQDKPTVEEPLKTKTPESTGGFIFSGPVIVVLVIIIGIGLMFAARYYKTQNPPVSTSAMDTTRESAPESSKKKSLVSIGGAFSLTDHNNQQVTEKTYAGQYMLVFFGYTFCPDVCPTALTTLSNTMDILGDAAEKVTPIFISVDPERDTPAHLKEYIGYFHPKLVGLTGTEAQIKAVTKAYRVYYAKAKVEQSDPDDYLMDHSSIIYLMGPDGTFVEHFSHGMEPEEIAERLLKHL